MKMASGRTIPYDETVGLDCMASRTHLRLERPRRSTKETPRYPGPIPRERLRGRALGKARPRARRVWVGNAAPPVKRRLRGRAGENHRRPPANRSAIAAGVSGPSPHQGAH